MSLPSSRARRSAALAPWLALAALAAGCARGRAADVAAGSAGTTCVVVVSIDTLRADRLPAYGYRGVVTPAIDALRRDATLFENAYSHVPLTLPSHASLLTGLLPPEHGVRNNVGYRLDPKHATLASLLKARGYATGAFVSAYVLRRATGLDAGFDTYAEVATASGTKTAAEVQRPGAETVRLALDWLASIGDRPFFLFVHVYEPHTPYAPPEPFSARYGPTYDGEIAAADAAVGTLLDGLRARGRYDRALVVLASDHGEGLGDHGEQEHGILLYREVLRVPLLVKPPGARTAASNGAPAGLRDVLPTVLAAIGAERPAAVHGRDLLAPAGRLAPAVYSETFYPRIHLGWSELRSLVDDRYHLVDGPRPELFDVTRDPGERSDLAETRTSVATALRGELASASGVFTAPAAATREEQQALASLGYVSAGSAAPAPDGSLPNPRDRIAAYPRIRDAFALAAAGRDEDAVAALDAVLAENPGFVDALVERAAASGRLGRFAESEAGYRQAIALSPTLAAPLALTLGRILLERGRLDAATASARSALAAEPAAAHELLAGVALARGEIDEAEREAGLVTGDAGAEARAAVVRAEVTARRGRPGDALRDLEAARRRAAALGLGPVPYAEFVRGDVLARLGRHAEAETALRGEIAAFPSHARAYASLAIVAALRGRPLEESRSIVARMNSAAPGPQTAALAARSLEFIGDPSGASRWRRRASKGGPS